MAKVRIGISTSLDGFTAGPDPSEVHPLGVGGMGLHEWVFKLAAWRVQHGLAGGEVNASTAVVEASQRNVGAVVMGRNMFGGGPGPWGEQPWNGWWGDDPPFHAPVFVVTHHPRAPLQMRGGTTFYFITAGIEAAVAEALDAAGGKDVTIGGGANVIQQCLVAGLADELRLDLAPILLHDGTRLFDALAGSDLELEPIEVIDAPGVAHLSYRVVK